MGLHQTGAVHKALDPPAPAARGVVPRHDLACERVLQRRHPRQELQPMFPGNLLPIVPVRTVRRSGEGVRAPSFACVTVIMASSTGSAAESRSCTRGTPSSANGPLARNEIRRPSMNCMPRSCAVAMNSRGRQCQADLSGGFHSPTSTSAFAACGRGFGVVVVGGLAEQSGGFEFAALRGGERGGEFEDGV